ncbi:MAG: type IA DNA topoisomerase [Lachnospiraceae bacterium]|nr:type IA DNA topoisomerase [Lachnospiraceae bacterium]
MKTVYIAEKPMVARAFADCLGESMSKHDGYQEGENSIVTWCFGHLVMMSYPDTYDEKYKKWRLDTLPFLPESYKYEIIPNAKKQFEIVKNILTRPDVDKIYVCTDSGREGEYIYRLVRQEANVSGKEERRGWIDSQTKEEILRGIREAKPLSEYDRLSDSAYLRAKEDYLMGMNFSRLLSVKYGREMAGFLHEKYSVISVGRVMTCVLGMVVERERSIRDFKKTPFYKPIAHSNNLALEWKVTEASKYKDSPLLYKDNGFAKKEDALSMLRETAGDDALLIPEDGVAPVALEGKVIKVTRKKEKKNPPLLYNLAEIQNDASKFFKISPEQTLNTIQSLYEKKLVTYPRTDARVLSTAVAKEITKNIRGLSGIPGVAPFVKEILDNGLYKGIEKSRYTNDSKITDHYAIIPTGSGLSALKGLDATSVKVYETIVRRFLAIFFPASEFEKISAEVGITAETTESFFANAKVMTEIGYLKVMNYSFGKKSSSSEEDKDDEAEDTPVDAIAAFKKGQTLDITGLSIKEGETSPPKRYTSGSMILAMENAGNLIEDEELREQIKGAGIGTSATRASILEKLVKNKYLSLNKKTQVITPTLTGEMIYDIVNASIRSLLNPKLTASWEKGLSMVADGEITSDEYMVKLTDFVTKNVTKVKSLGYMNFNRVFSETARFYKTGSYGGIKKSKGEK